MKKTVIGLLLATCLFGCGGGDGGSDEPEPVRVTSDVEEFTEFKKDVAEMTGTVAPPDATVAVNGITADVANGRWTARVRLPDVGEEDVRIEATKPGHVTARVNTVIVRERTAREASALRKKRQRAQAKADRKRKAAAEARRAREAKAEAERNRPVTVPDVVGQRLDLAKKDVRSAGLRPAEIDAEGTSFGIVLDSNWTVCRMSPGAGTSVKKGTRVSLHAKKSGC
jgi:PASTA domain